MRIFTLILAVFFVFGFVVTDTVFAQLDPALIEARKSALENELKEYEKQVEEYQNLVSEKQKEGESLKRDIEILNTKIASAKLAIKARNISIEKLSLEINQKSKNISSLSLEIENAKLVLGDFLRKINENDNFSPIELAIVYQDVSVFFDEMESLNKMQDSLQESLLRFSNLKSEEEVARNELTEKKNEELELRAIQELQKKKLDVDETEKKNILKITKGVESAYQKVVDLKKKDAASIRSQLFLLEGSPDIPFEKAIELANLAQKHTGIRPAFLLAVITEESNLGRNVGKGNWKQDLSHTRCAKQRTAFVEITSELGLNPDLMPVSKKVWYGYCGGAMGPAQFMPTTWQLYKKGVSKITGNNPPNPWEAEDAFVASALLLRDNGAKAGNTQSEWKAAMKYLAGSNWNKPAYRFYGDDIMAIAVKYQEQITLLQSFAQR